MGLLPGREQPEVLPEGGGEALVMDSLISAHSMLRPTLLHAHEKSSPLTPWGDRRKVPYRRLVEAHGSGVMHGALHGQGSVWLFLIT